MSIKSRLSEERYMQLLESSLIFAGNNARMKAALNKPAPKIAVLGGSVSAGYSNSALYDLRDQYPSLAAQMPPLCGNCELLNLSTTGSGPAMGIILTQLRLTQYKPDIVLLEYGVNDEKTPQGFARFEGLVRMLLGLDSAPAVAVILIRSLQGYCCKSYMLPTAEHYSLPVVSINDALTELLDSAEAQWSDYSDDTLHANTDGHIFIADCVSRLFRRIKESTTDDPCAIPQEPLFSSEYGEIRFVLPENTGELPDDARFYEARKHFTRYGIDDADAPLFSAELVCGSLWAVYLHCNDEGFGAAEVIIDGKHCAELDGYSIFGWGNAFIKPVLELEKPSPHKIEIKKGSSSRKKPFYLLGVAWC